MKLHATIEEVAYHRNGVSGVPVYVVLFTEGIGGLAGGYVATVLPAKGAVVVLDRDLLGAGEIRFFYNSFDGPMFEPYLRKAIEQYDGRRDDKELFAHWPAKPFKVKL